MRSIPIQAYRPPEPSQMSPLVHGLPVEPIKGRGTAWSLAHRFNKDERLAYDDGWGTLEQSVLEQPLPPATQVLEERVKTILAGNDSPDIGFDLVDQPLPRLRTWLHLLLCPAHPQLPEPVAGAGLRDPHHRQGQRRAAPARGLLPAATTRRCCSNIGSATDAYQPAERKLGITRSVIEVLAEHHHPFSLITKSAGVERDLDLIAPMAQRNLAAVYLSITTLDAALARVMEPRAVSPERRRPPFGGGRCRCASGRERVAGDPLRQ